MKVLVYLNHGSSKGLLLNLKEAVSMRDVKKILEENTQRDAISRLILRSSSMVEVPPENITKAKLSANFTISDHYTVERLG